MNISEEQLRAAIQIALGTLDIYSNEAEETLVHHTKSLSNKKETVNVDHSVFRKILDKQKANYYRQVVPGVKKPDLVSDFIFKEKLEQAYNAGVEAEKERCGEFDVTKYL